MMETAGGQSINKELQTMPHPGQLGHGEAVAELVKRVRSVGEAMAEMHRAFATGNPESLEQKKAELSYIIDTQLSRIKSAISSENYEAIDAKLRTNVGPAFLRSHVPSTAYHGDANIGNFMVDKNYNVMVIDVGTMRWSLDSAGNGKSTGAADAGRFIQSLEASNTGALAPTEMMQVQRTFTETYLGAAGISAADFEPGILLFRSQLEIAAIKFSTTRKEAAAALERLGRLLGLSSVSAGEQP